MPQVANATKLAAVHQRLDHVRILKNRMGEHVHQGLSALMRSPTAFKAGYQQFSGTGVLKRSLSSNQQPRLLDAAA